MPRSNVGYDQLIGSWEVDVFDYKPDGTRRVSSGEWHFAWVLEGRAVQDVLIVPPRGARRLREVPGPGNRYGTTIRVYDPSRDAWNVTWFNPVAGIQGELIGADVATVSSRKGKSRTGKCFGGRSATLPMTRSDGWGRSLSMQEPRGISHRSSSPAARPNARRA